MSDRTASTSDAFKRFREAQAEMSNAAEELAASIAEVEAALAAEYHRNHNLSPQVAEDLKAVFDGTAETVEFDWKSEPTMTSYEYKSYQHLVSKGYSKDDAREAALGGVDIRDLREGN